MLVLPVWDRGLPMNPPVRVYCPIHDPADDGRDIGPAEYRLAWTDHTGTPRSAVVLVLDDEPEHRRTELPCWLCRPGTEEQGR